MTKAITRAQVTNLKTPTTQTTFEILRPDVCHDHGHVLAGECKKSPELQYTGRGVYLFALEPMHNLSSFFVTPWPVFRGELHAMWKSAGVAGLPNFDTLKLRRILYRLGSVFSGMNDIRKASSSVEEDANTLLSWFRSCRRALLEARDFAVSLEIVLLEARMLFRSCGSHRSQNFALKPSEAAWVTCWTRVTAIATKKTKWGED